MTFHGLLEYGTFSSNAQVLRSVPISCAEKYRDAAFGAARLWESEHRGSCKMTEKVSARRNFFDVVSRTAHVRLHHGAVWGWQELKLAESPG